MAYHLAVSMLQALISFVQALKIPYFLSQFECLEFHLCYLQVFIVASSRFFISMFEARVFCCSIVNAVLIGAISIILERNAMSYTCVSFLIHH